MFVIAHLHSNQIPRDAKATIEQRIDAWAQWLSTYAQRLHTSLYIDHGWSDATAFVQLHKHRLTQHAVSTDPTTTDSIDPTDNEQSVLDRLSQTFVSKNAVFQAQSEDANTCDSIVLQERRNVRKQLLQCSNPVFVLRKAAAQAAIEQAVEGDFSAYQALLLDVQHPYDNTMT